MSKILQAKGQQRPSVMQYRGMHLRGVSPRVLPLVLQSQSVLMLQAKGRQSQPVPLLQAKGQQRRLVMQCRGVLMLQATGRQC